jgi:hypothetical protein
MKGYHPDLPLFLQSFLDVMPCFDQRHSIGAPGPGPAGSGGVGMPVLHWLTQVMVNQQIL